MIFTTGTSEYDLEKHTEKMLILRFEGMVVGSFIEMPEVNNNLELWSFSSSMYLGCELAMLCAEILTALENGKLEMFHEQREASA